MTSGNFGGLGSRRNINTFYAPVYLGDLGFPHLGSFLSSDCVDSLSAYTCVMTTLSDITPSPGGKQEIGRLLHATLHQQPRVVSPWALLANLYSASAEGVPDLIGSLQNRVKAKMASVCKSDIFKSSLQATYNKATESLHKILPSIVADAAIIEQLGSASPVGFNNAIADKAYRNELVLILFNYKIQDTYLDRCEKV